MSSVQQTIDRYVAIWNETDAAQRLSLIEATWTEDGHYVDPAMSGSGHVEFNALVEGVQAQFAGHQVRRTTGIDAYGDWARFSWALVSDATGGTVGAGTDFVQLAPDGRLAAITGFFDHLAGNDEGS